MLLGHRGVSWSNDGRIRTYRITRRGDRRFKHEGIAYEVVEARGQSALAQVLSSVFLGDYCSFYLSMLNEVDPTSTDAINFVKQHLAQSAISSD